MEEQIKCEKQVIQKAFKIVYNMDKKSSMLSKDLTNDEFFKNFYTTSQIKTFTTPRLYTKVMKLLQETKTLHKVKYKRKTYVILNYCQNYFSHNYEATEKAIQEYENIGLRRLANLKAQVTKLKTNRL